MQRETPEGVMVDPIIEERLLDQIENRITFLIEELEELKKKMQRERKRFKLRQLEERKQQLEYELRWARYQEQHLSKSIFRMETKEA